MILDQILTNLICIVASITGQI